MIITIFIQMLLIQLTRLLCSYLLGLWSILFLDDCFMSQSDMVGNISPTDIFAMETICCSWETRKAETVPAELKEAAETE